MAENKVYHIVAAIIRRGDEILMVHQRAPDSNAWWSTPGGVVEDGETLIDALAREVREETGLDVLEPGRLVYVTQWEDVPENHQAIAFVFEIQRWQGELKPADPDGLVTEASFLPIDRVIANLQTVKWGILTEPAIAYLRGQAPVGSVWIYRWDENENISLVARVP
ncbi:MAG: NUDIX hydrolase [Chloroflexi bacterium]|nr:NUDIX hydrolase [Chloroflexota bacterium]